jgi:hypothetical protein
LGAYALAIGEPRKSFEGLRDYKPLPLISHYQSPKNKRIGESLMSLKLVCEKILLDK